VYGEGKPLLSFAGTLKQQEYIFATPGLQALACVTQASLSFSPVCEISSLKQTQRNRQQKPSPQRTQKSAEST
jgi:hypothetical protein